MTPSFLARFSRRARIARDLYEIGVAQSRVPFFYRARGISDTVDGRFELTALHAFLIWNRLRGEGKEGAKLAQAVFDAMFRDMERALRLMGIGDLSIPHHIKRMMRGFKGRSIAYRDALENPDDPEIMLSALRRNLYGTAENWDAPEMGVQVRWFAGYVRAAARHLADQPFDDLRRGTITFQGLLDEQETHAGDAHPRMVV